AAGQRPEGFEARVRSGGQGGGHAKGGGQPRPARGQGREGGQRAPEARAGLARGSATCRVAPSPSSLLVAHRRPPWSVTIVRQMARPSPRPPCFEVTKGWKIFSNSAGAIPVPRSTTEMATPSRPSLVVATVSHL